MADCNFKFPVPESSEKYVAAAKSAITGHKGTFDGDGESGSFQVPVGIGDIEGDYTISDGSIHIHITRKPLIVTCHMIETRLKGYLEPK